MSPIGRCIATVMCAAGALLAQGSGLAAPLEFNPLARGAAVPLGPQAHRFIVGFKAGATGTLHESYVRRAGRSYRIVQARTDERDARELAGRAGLALAATRQITPSLQVLFVPKTLYGAEVEAALARLRADPSVEFAAVDGKRHPMAAVTPNDPLFPPTPGSANGQWYLGAPNANAVVEGVPTQDLSATDVVDAWGITEGAAGVVIADVDTGVRFDHPDLLRAGQGGRLLPGYDFVGEDYNPSSPYNPLGTYLIANDGDGWDPDPSDPGDWIDATDLSNPNNLFAGDTQGPSSWHGTRVVGVFGAMGNNAVGIAGVSWNSWILPVRALGKGGGYDSDIIAGIEWAAGMTVMTPDGLSAVPSNPYPADIINLSIGGSPATCAGSAYESALTSVTQMGVLVVIAAGNADPSTGTNLAVNLPGTCAATIPGVMTVAGLRNVGTKVGYSSFGPEVSIAAPAGNCINSGTPCLRSIDTTTNDGATTPGTNTYTNETSPNLGTSFATPLVSGIAGLMRAVNNNLTPAQLAARLSSSATAFPPAGAVPVCPNSDPTSGECACPATGQCGVGMVNALAAVQAAQRPIAAVQLPIVLSAGAPATFDASGSAAACGRAIKSYAWSASGLTITSATNASTATVLAGSGTLTVTVMDDAGDTDAATITIMSVSGAINAVSSAPASAGAAACPKAINPTPAAPTVTQAFSPATVAANADATLTVTLGNSNGFALTQSSFSQTLPSGLVIAANASPSTTCGGAGITIGATGSTITLAGAVIPASGSCSVSVSVTSKTPGTYTSTVPANALMTAPAGGNAAPSSTALTVNAPSSGGGGAIGWLELAGGALLMGLARRAGRRAAAQRRSGAAA